MLTFKTAIVVGLVLGAFGFVVSAFYWPHLPEPMVTHWDAHGTPNGYGSRIVGALVMPAMIVSFGLIFALLARISPQGYGLRQFEDSVAVITIALQVFLLIVHVVTLRAARTGTPLQAGWFLAGMGALFAVMGNRFGKVRRNFFIGIRTPWTLADEEVWLRTHRLAGKLFVLAGLFTMVLALVPNAMLAMIPALLVAGLVPVVYSFVVYRQLHPGARA
ncbi:MAG: SdpI family protein [Deltaproteobacteria bacterium]|nr:SdpI family protein [Deltaproteobacteria bacterium]